MKMELSTSNHSLSPNGLDSNKDYPLQIKDERKDELCINDKTILNPDAFHQAPKYEVNQTFEAKDMQHGHCDNIIGPGKKRKLSDSGPNHESHEKLSKIDKISEPDSSKQEIQNGSQTTNLTKSPLSKVPKNRRSLWILSCDRCSFETENMDEFTCHIDTLHSNLSDFKCHKCNFASTSSSLVQKHDRLVHDDERENDSHSSLKNIEEYAEKSSEHKDNFVINCPQPSLAIDRLQDITETENGEPQCPYCQFSNVATESVIEHMNVFHERRKWYGCPLCPLNSSCKRTIVNHLRKKHDLITNEVFLDAILLSITKNENENKKNFKCLKCDRKFRRIKSWEKHLNSHLSSMSLKVTPNSLSQKYRNDPLIKTMNNVMQNIENANMPENYFESLHRCNSREMITKSYICKKNSEKYSTNSSDFAQVDNHRFKCPECDALSKYTYNIKGHMKIFHNKSSADIPNEIELLKYSENEYSEKHLQINDLDQIMEGGIYTLNKLSIDSLVNLIKEIDDTNYSDDEKRYQCLVCLMISKYKRHVLTHIKNVHGKMKKYFCQICDFLHPSPNQVKEHYENTHVIEHTIQDILDIMYLPKEKSGKTYKAPPTLTFEVALKEDLPCRKKFLNGKPYYECPYCSLAKKNETSVQIHINAFHKMITWFKCPSCNEAYLQTSSLRDHLKKVHEITKSTEEVEYMVIRDNSEIKKFRHHKLAWSYSQRKIEEFQRNLNSSPSKTKRRFRFINENGGVETKQGYYCIECDVFFSAFSLYLMHNKKDHKSQERIPRLTNNKNISILPNSILPLPHETSHHKLNNTCSLSDLSASLSNKIENKLGPERCLENGHMRIRCPYCKNLFASSQACKEHINSKHEKMCSYQCPQCDYQTYRRRSLKQHLIDYHINKPSKIRQNHSSTLVGLDYQPTRTLLEKSITNSLIEDTDEPIKVSNIRQFLNTEKRIECVEQQPNYQSPKIKKIFSEDLLSLNRDLVKMCNNRRIQGKRKNSVSIRSKKKIAFQNYFLEAKEVLKGERKSLRKNTKVDIIDCWKSMNEEAQLQYYDVSAPEYKILEKNHMNNRDNSQSNFFGDKKNSKFDHYMKKAINMIINE